jgi:hypothetical protein
MAQTRFSGPVASDNGFVGTITSASGTSTFADVSITGNTAIGDAATDTVGFYGVAQVAQPATTGTTTGFTAGSGTAARADSTYTGNTGTAAYTVGDIVKALKDLGLLAA